MELYKNSSEAGREVRSSGQTGITPNDSVEAPARTGIAPAPSSFPSPQEYLQSIRSSGPAEQAPSSFPSPDEYLANLRNPSVATQAQPVAQPVADPSIGDSLKKGYKSVMVTWDFLANKLEKAVTGSETDTAPILEKSVREYKNIASDPKIQEFIQLGNDAPDAYSATKAMLGYLIDNPMMGVNFLAEQAAPMAASIPLGGVGGRIATGLATKAALKGATAEAVGMAGFGAATNASSVVLASLGPNFVEGLDKFNGDRNAAKDYATLKTVSEVPANAIAGLFMGVNPLAKIAAKSPIGSNVGNAVFQAGVQGAGGATGAYQAGEAVGDPAGRGELIAEMLGEAAFAPVELATGSRGIKKPTDKPITPPENTQTQESKPADTPSFGMTDQEFFGIQKVKEGSAFLAAMYARSDEDTKAQIQNYVTKTGMKLDLEAASKNQSLVSQGEKIISVSPTIAGQFQERLGQFYERTRSREQAPSSVDISKPPKNPIPMEEQIRLAKDMATEEQLIAEGKLTSKNLEAKKPEAVVNTPTEQINIPPQSSNLEQLSQAETRINSQPPVVQNPAPKAPRREASTPEDFAAIQEVVDGLNIKVITPKQEVSNNQSEVKPAAAVEKKSTGITPEQKSEYISLFQEKAQSISGLPLNDISNTLKGYAEDLRGYGLTDEEIASTLQGKKKSIDKDGNEKFTSYGYDPRSDGGNPTSVKEADVFGKSGNPNVFVGSDNRLSKDEISLDRIEIQRKQQAKKTKEKIKSFESEPYSDAKASAIIREITDTDSNGGGARSQLEYEIVNKDNVVVTKVFSTPRKGQYSWVAFKNLDGIDGADSYSRSSGKTLMQAIGNLGDLQLRKAGKGQDSLDIAVKQDKPKAKPVEKALPATVSAGQQKINDEFNRQIKADADKQKRIEAWKKENKEDLDTGPGIFDDDAGGVIGNLARSGAMGSDASIELKRKENKDAAQSAEAKKKVSELSKNMDAQVANKLSELETIRNEMKSNGAPDSEIEATVGSVEDVLKAQQDELIKLTKDQLADDTTYISEPTIKKGDAAELPAGNDAIQGGLDLENDRQVAALQLADAISKGEVNMEEALKQVAKEQIGYMYLMDALRRKGIEVTKSQIDLSGRLAVNFRLSDYISRGDTALAREQWMKSLDSTLKDLANTPAQLAQFENTLTESEKTFYAGWKKNRENYLNRLANSTEESDVFTSYEDVFPNSLFVHYTLNEMKNPALLPEPMRSTITDLFSDPVAAWKQDVLDIMSIRPDFRAEVMDNLTPADKTEVMEFALRKLEADKRAAEMMVKSPAYSQLNQLRFLSPDMYYQYQADIRMAEERELSTILHEASEMNDRAQAAIDAGADPTNTIDYQMSRILMQDEGWSINPEELARLNEESDEQADGEVPLDEAFKEPPRFKRGRYSNVVASMAIQEHLTNLFSSWDVKPSYTVMGSSRQLPTDVAERFTSVLGHGNFKGAIDPKTGHIYLFSEMMESVQDAEFVTFHELYGHWGLKAFLGDKLNPFLENQYKLNKKVRELADSSFAEAQNNNQAMTRLEAIEEAISDLAAKGDGNTFREIIGKLADWLREHGMTAVANWIDSTGDSQLSYVLAQARKAARTNGISSLNGAPESVKYAYNKPAVEIFATRDGQTTGYARINPIQSNWTVFTKNDKGEWGSIAVDDYAQAKALLDKVGKPFRTTERSSRQEVNPDQVLQIPAFNDVKGWSKLMRNSIIAFQNQYLPVMEVAKFLSKNGKENNVVNDIVLYEGRTAPLIEGMRKEFQEPIEKLLKSIGDKGGSVEQLDRFLLARHAPERNKQINKINPKNPSGSGMATKLAEELMSSNSDGLWTSYRDDMEKVGALMDRMASNKVAYMVKTGLINEATGNALNNYESYVNLSGNNELKLDEYDKSNLGPNGFNFKGKEVKTATGRGTEPVDILQNTMNAYISTLIRGQKAIVQRSILSMFESNPDATFVQINPIVEKKKLNLEKLITDRKILKSIGDKPTEASGYQFLDQLKQELKDGVKDSDAAQLELLKRISDAEKRRDITPAEAIAANRKVTEEAVMSGRLSPDGYVSMVEDPNLLRDPNVLIARRDGVPIVMRFTDRGQEFVKSISGGRETRSDLVNAVGGWNRLFSQMVTSWNPAWIIPNGWRDAQLAFSNAAADPEIGPVLAKEMLKNWYPSLSTAFRYLVADQADTKSGFMGSYLNHQKTKKPIDPEEAKIYQRYLDAGAQTYFLDRKGVEASLEKLNRHMYGPQGLLENTQDKLEGVGDLMELLSMPMEVAPRLAMFKVLIKNGWTDERAAKYVKELTVNFNMKGASQNFRALYVFANPAIQGTVRMFQNYSRGEDGFTKFLPSNQFIATAGVWMVLGMMGNMMARAIGGEDDDKPGIDKLDMIPNYKRATALIFAPGVPGGAIPIAYGWNVPFAMGHYLADVWGGKLKAEEAASRVLSVAFDSFAPVGSGAESNTTTGAVLKTILPSPLVPIYELGANENRFGGPISKGNDSYSDVKEAQAYMNFKTANPISVGLFRTLNSATGGSQYESGILDINPSKADYFIQSYLPGLFTELYKGAGLGIQAARGENTKDAPIPLVDRLTAKVPEGYDAGAMRRAGEVVQTRYREMMSPSTTQERRQQIMTEHPNLGGAKAIISGADQMIKQMRIGLQAIESNPRYTDEYKTAARNKVAEQEKLIQNRVVNAALKAGFRDAIISNGTDGSSLNKIGRLVRSQPSPEQDE